MDKLVIPDLSKEDIPDFTMQAEDPKHPSLEEIENAVKDSDGLSGIQCTS